MLELYRNACARPFQLATTPGFQVNTLRGALYDTWYYTILLHAKPPPCLAFWKVVQCATSIVRTYIPTGTHRFCGIRCLTRDILSSTLSVSPPPGVASVDDHLRQPRSCETADPHLASPPTTVTAPECIECIRAALTSTASFLCAMAVIFSGQPAILGANRRAELQSIFNYLWQRSACTPCEQVPLVQAPTMKNQGRCTSIPLILEASEVV